MGDAIGTGVTEEDVEGGYEEATKARLRAELRLRGLSDAGDTEDLIERLREDDAQDTARDDDPRDEAEPSGGAGDDVAEDDDEPAGDGPSEDGSTEELSHAEVTSDETSDEPADGEPSGGEPEAQERSSSEDDSGERPTSAGRSKGDRREQRGGTSARPRRRLVHDPPLRRAAQLVASSTGLKVDTVSRAIHDDGAWYVQVELVEVPHVPPSRDILGSYVVVIGDDGVVRAVERMRQYRRQA